MRVTTFVVGNSKSGTSALCDFLHQHPDVCVSNPKEPNYFATDFAHDYPEGAFSRLTAEQYEQCYTRCAAGAHLVDGSAAYLYSTEAAANISEYNPEARIVAVFREPVDFLVSYHAQMLRNVASEGEVIVSLSDALDAEDDRVAGKRIPVGCRVPEMLFYRRRVRYAEQLERFYRSFRSDQIAVYIYDDFVDDNVAVMQDVYRHLGVDPDFQPTTHVVNRASRTRAPRLARAIQDIAHGRNGFERAKKVAVGIVPDRWRKSMLRAATRAIAKPGKQGIPDSLRLSLQREFVPEVERLGRLIDQDLVARWGYSSAQ